MSKKQQTLFQSWGAAKPSTSRGGDSHTHPPSKESADLIDLASEDEDEALMKAMEASLLEYESRSVAAAAETRPLTRQEQKHPELVPSATALEELPGFDYESGKTWIYPCNYPIRQYQRSIIHQCLFKNTLVSLPTGLGKTFIAAVVMYNFFRWYPQSKVIFMAPTKPLVAQQIDACFNIMGIPRSATSEMTGEMSPDDRHKEWREKRVFFITPQILVNDVSRCLCPAEKIKCVVLDEAHRASGNYAYVQVIKELNRLQVSFRVVALSATPGNDLQAIQQVVRNLNISHIELRNEDSPDIQAYSHQRLVDVIVVPLGTEVADIKDRYLHVLGKYARRLMNLNLLFVRDVGSLTKFALIKARDIFRQNPSEKIPRTSYGMIEGDFALCISLTHALELLQKHGVRSFYNYLSGIESAGKDNTPSHNRLRNELRRCPEFTDLMKFMDEKVAADFCSHPKMAKLEEIIVEHFRRFQRENQPTRVIIFSQFRDSVTEISSVLEKHAPLVKPLSFLGHGTSKGKRITQGDQLRVVKQFREGLANTLVSTSVGEEGLDIGDVDLIICYDAHKSPIRLVQRMGRTGRKRQGRIVMLMTEGKEEHAYKQGVYQQKKLGNLSNLEEKMKKYYMENCPRLVPRGLNPECLELHMAVEPSVKAAKPSGSAFKCPRTSVKNQSKKACFLTPAELDYHDKKFRMNAPVPALPMPGQRTSTGLLDFNGCYLWQNELQPAVTGHSSAARNLVDTMVFIQIQHEHKKNGRKISYYDLEMETHLDDEDIDPSARNLTCLKRLPIEGDEDSFINEPCPSPPPLAPFSARVPAVEPESLVLKTENSALFCPIFLQLFDLRTDTAEDFSIPSPPPLVFHISPESSPLRRNEIYPLAEQIVGVPDVSVNWEELAALCENDLSVDQCDVIPATPSPRKKPPLLARSPVLSGTLSQSLKRRASPASCSSAPKKCRLTPTCNAGSPEARGKDETLLTVTQIVHMINKTPPRSVTQPLVPPIKKLEKLIPDSITSWDCDFDLQLANFDLDLDDLAKNADLACEKPPSKPVVVGGEFKTPERKCLVKIQSASTPAARSATNSESSENVAGFVVSEEDSPMFAKPFKLKRNLLSTQSTPKAAKPGRFKVASEHPREGAGRHRKTAKRGCSFIEHEVEVSDDDASTDEDVGDLSFDSSFIDDDSTHHDEDMQAIYLRSVKSPTVRNGFVQRELRRPMKYSQVFSQANVEQDSSYAYDSFCVPNDVEEAAVDQSDESAETPRQEVGINPTGKKRKRIMIMSDSSENEDSPRCGTRVAPVNPLLSPVISGALSNFGNLSKEERLRRQRQKQEEFRQKMMAITETDATKRPGFKADEGIPKNSCTTSADGKALPSPLVRQSASKVVELKLSEDDLISPAAVKLPPAPFTKAPNPRALGTSLAGPSQALSSTTGMGMAEVNKHQVCEKRALVNCSLQAASATAIQSSFPWPSTSLARELSTSYTASENANVTRQQRGLPHVLMISSRVVSSLPDMISHWKNVLKGVVQVGSFTVADIVISSNVGVLRKLHSDFANGNNRQKLQEQVRTLIGQFERPFLVVEMDRERGTPVNRETGLPSFPLTSAIYKPNSPFEDLTLAALAQTELLVLHSSSQQETAALLNRLAAQEMQRGHHLPEVLKFGEKEKRLRQFLQHIPTVNPAVALLLAANFSSLNEIMNSSPNALTAKCNISLKRARELFQSLRRNLRSK